MCSFVMCAQFILYKNVFICKVEWKVLIIKRMKYKIIVVVSYAIHYIFSVVFFYYFFHKLSVWSYRNKQIVNKTEKIWLKLHTKKCAITGAKNDANQIFDIISSWWHHSKLFFKESIEIRMNHNFGVFVCD